MSGAPEWFSIGQAVPDVFARSYDAEFILDDDFDTGETRIDWGSLDWRECDIPVAAFGFSFPTIEAHLLALPRANLDEELARTDGLRAWVTNIGGIVAALQQSPLLVTLRDGTPHIEDGFHRLGVAIFDHGATHVPAPRPSARIR